MVRHVGSNCQNSRVIISRNGYDLAPESRNTGVLMFRMVCGSISGNRVPVVIITSHLFASRSVSCLDDSDILSQSTSALHRRDHLLGNRRLFELVASLRTLYFFETELLVELLVR